MMIFLKGFIFGFLIAAPVGPIGMLCVQRTLVQGMTAGFVFGLGTALADALYCAIAVLGVTTIANVLQEYQFSLNFIGSIALICLGYHTFHSQPGEASPAAVGGSKFNAFAASFLLTLTNPLMILAFAAVCAGIGLSAYEVDYWAAALLVFGVLLGSSAAWLALSGFVSRIRTSFSPLRLQRINRILGIFISGLGVICLINILIK